MPLIDHQPGPGRRFLLWCQQTLLRPIADALLAQSCALCQQPSGSTPICPGCAQDLPFLPGTPGSHCPRCALPLYGGSTSCPDCARHHPAFDRATAVWAYAFPIDTLIRDFKYGHHLYLGRFFAEQLAQTLLHDWNSTHRAKPDLIIPMPLHPNRLKTRGFNQAAEIARHLARLLDIPCAYDALTRLQDTPAQAGLPREARWQNLIGAFACPPAMKARHVLLVDDVLTTGASLSACADILRQSGITTVDAAVLARTPGPDLSSRL